MAFICLYSSKQLQKAYRGDISQLTRSEPLPSPAYCLVSGVHSSIPINPCSIMHVYVNNYNSYVLLKANDTLGKTKHQGHLVLLLAWILGMFDA